MSLAWVYSFRVFEACSPFCSEAEPSNIYMHDRTWLNLIYNIACARTPFEATTYFGAHEQEIEDWS